MLSAIPQTRQRRGIASSRAINHYVNTRSRPRLGVTGTVEGAGEKVPCSKNITRARCAEKHRGRERQIARAREQAREQAREREQRANWWSDHLPDTGVLVALGHGAVVGLLPHKR